MEQAKKDGFLPDPIWYLKRIQSQNADRIAKEAENGV